MVTTSEIIDDALPRYPSFCEYTPPTKIRLTVGWAYPQMEDDVCFNFHLSSMLLDWTETVPLYVIIDFFFVLDEESLDKVVHLPFPAWIKEPQKVLDVLLPAGPARWNAQRVKRLLAIASELQEWFQSLLAQVKSLPQTPRELLKQIFFRSTAKIEVFEFICDGSSSLALH
eukprot:gene10709-11887_t